jgi:hypothetical protein
MLLCTWSYLDNALMTIHFVMGSGDSAIKQESFRRVITGGNARHSTKIVRVPRQADLIEAGRKAWTALHSYQGDDPKTFFYQVFLPMVPSYGCSCRKDFDKILEQFPPDFSSPETFFHWGVFVHNLVNEKLGKPIMDHDEARKLWQGDKPDGSIEGEARTN